MAKLPSRRIERSLHVHVNMQITDFARAQGVRHKATAVQIITQMCLNKTHVFTLLETTSILPLEAWQVMPGGQIGREFRLRDRILAVRPPSTRIRLC